MVKNNALLIVGVAIVVAIIASVITANVTGNVINLNADKFGKYPVYTKQEVDAKLTAMDIKFSDSNNVAIAINKRIYIVSVEDNYTNSLVARCRDSNDIPLSGHCKTSTNNAIANHGTVIYKDSSNKGGFACSNEGSLMSGMKTTVYCIDLE